MPEMRKPVKWALAFMLPCFAWAERLSFQVTSSPVHSGDEGVWASIAQQPVLSMGFWTASRPFSVPLLYKLTGGDEETVMHLQSAVSVACWFALAVVAASCLRRPLLGVGSAVVVCALSLSIPINQWDHVVRSESLSLSMLAFVCAMSLWGARQLADARPLGPVFLVVWTLAVLAFVGTRDSIAYSLLALGGVYGVWLVVHLWRGRLKRGPHYRAVAWSLSLLTAASVGAAEFSRWSNAYGQRWRTPLINVLLHRIIARPTVHAEWKTSYGLPANPSFEAYAGKFAWDALPGASPIRQQLRDSTALADVEEWLLRRGISSYQEWLLIDHPVLAVSDTFAHFDQGVNDHNRDYGLGAGDVPLTRAVTTVFYHRIPGPAFVCLLALAGSAAFGYAFPRYRLVAFGSSFLFMNCWIQAFVGFHGDAAEVPRHMMLVGVLLRLGLILLALVIISRLADAIETRWPPRAGEAA